MDDTGTIKGRYLKLASLREPYLQRARQAATVTIPSLVPPLGSTGSTRLPTPFQSLGARGVNNLASKLLLALLPPNTPFFKLNIDDFALQELTQREGMRGDVEEALNSIERSVNSEIETSTTRTGAFEALKHLLVAGNVLLYVQPQGGLRVFQLSRYVTKRDPMGNIMETITVENISAMELPPEVAKHIGDPDGDKSEKGVDDVIELYTHIKRSPQGWDIQQEVNGHLIPGSKGSYPLDKSPWIALRYFAVDNEDYGRGFVEEYMGDLLSLEGLTKAIVQGSAAAAKVLFLVNAAATTKKKDLTESESGDVITGSANDVSVLQLNKFADFRIAQETRKDLIESLSFAFMLHSAVQRNGDRVTAEEIRYMANELEASLGGAYATLSQEFQLPLVRRLMHQMERQGKLPTLPPGLVKPSIVTGVEAIGRGQDGNKLTQFFQGLGTLGPTALGMLHIDDAAKRWGTSLGIDMKGLLKTKEEVAQEQQQQQMQGMIQQGLPGAINAVGGIAKEAAKANHP